MPALVTRHPRLLLAGVAALALSVTSSAMAQGRGTPAAPRTRTATPPQPAADTLVQPDRWTRSRVMEGFLGMVLSREDSTLFVIDREGVHALATDSLRLRWSSSLRPTGGGAYRSFQSVAVTGGVVHLVEAKGAQGTQHDLVALESSTGAERWRVAGFARAPRGTLGIKVSRTPRVREDFHFAEAALPERQGWVITDIPDESAPAVERQRARERAASDRQLRSEERQRRRAFLSERRNQLSDSLTTLEIERPRGMSRADHAALLQRLQADRDSTTREYQRTPPSRPNAGVDEEGIGLGVGDIIVAIDGTPADLLWSVERLTARRQPGDTVAIEVVHGCGGRTGCARRVVRVPLGAGNAAVTQTAVPVRAESLVYAVANDELLGFEAASGVVRFSYVAGTAIHQPSVAGNLVVFGDSNCVLRAIDRRTGEERWVVERPRKPDQSYADDGSCARIEVAEAEGVVLVSRNEELAAHDAQTGILRWSAPLNWPSRATIIDGMVYVVRGDDVVAVRLGDGGQAWRRRHGRGPSWPDAPTVVGGEVLVGNYDFLMAFNAVTGDTAWIYSGSDGPTQVAVANGTAYLVDRYRTGSWTSTNLFQLAAVPTAWLAPVGRQILAQYRKPVEIPERCRAVLQEIAARRMDNEQALSYATLRNCEVWLIR